MVVTILELVQPAPIFHSSAREGANSDVAPAPKVPQSAGFAAIHAPFVIMFHRFSTVAEAS